jgi:alpha-L-arabinofuranosidase/6-phosphogluconate dehydrogenase (decarboxylating)
MRHRSPVFLFCINPGRFEMIGSNIKFAGKYLTIIFRIVLIGSVLLMGKPNPSFAQTPSATITIDGSTQLGAVNPYIYGNFSEWGNEYMNGAWAEDISDRSFENDSLTANSLELYDHFRGSAYQPKNWTPTLLAGSNTGTISVSNSQVSISGGSNSRFGLLSNYVQNSAYLTTRIEVRLNSYTGTNALLNIYGGTGSGDFSNYVEFGIENGVLKVFAPGADWTGSSASAPASLAVVVSGYGTNGRTFQFYYNGSLVHTTSNYTGVPNADFRLFLYGWSTSVSNWDWVTITHDGEYDHFLGTTLSNRWTPTLLAGSTNGSVSVANSVLTIAGSANSRYGVLSDYLPDSAQRTISVDAYLNSYSGQNAIIDIYGGTGAGDFSHFVEFGIENGTLKVWADGLTIWTGGQASTPAELTVSISPFGSTGSPFHGSGRYYKFYYNGSVVHTIEEYGGIGDGLYRVFLYGYGASTTNWDWLKITSSPRYDDFESNYLPGFKWAVTRLSGSNDGAVSVSNSILTINGGSSSRYGILSGEIGYGTTIPLAVEGRMVSYSGTNAMIDIYGGTGAGDFSNFIEFGIESGVLKVYAQDSSKNWTGGSATTPATLKILASGSPSGGRNYDFFYNGVLVHSLENDTGIPTTTKLRTFIYGWSTSATNWDWVDFYTEQPWNYEGYADAGHITLDGADKFNGNFAQKIVIDRHNNGEMGIAQHGIGVQQNQTYNVSLYLKQSGMSGNVKVSIGPNSSYSNSYTPYASYSISSVSSNWTKYSFTLTPNASDNDARFIITLNQTGTIWVDLVSFMTANNTDGFRTDVIDKVQALAPPILRWPGGVMTDWYHWLDGVGDRDQRPPFYIGWGSPSWTMDDTGFDEFMKFCDLVGSQAAIWVNQGSGTPQEAANWVEYANGSTNTTYGALRAANGHPDPYNVKYWGVGNEVWGGWERGYTQDPAVYSDELNQFVQVMRLVDPSIHIVAEGGEANYNYSQDWNRAVLKDAGDNFTDLSLHFYAPQWLPDSYSDEEVYKAVAAAPSLYETRTLDTQKSITDATPYDIKAAATEWNTMFNNTARLLERTQMAAVYAGGLLNVYQRNNQIFGLNTFSALVNFWDGCNIFLNSDGSYGTPVYYVLKMAEAHHGDYLLPTFVSAGTFNTQAFGDLPALTNIPEVDATATRTADGSHIFILLVNRRVSGDVTTSLNLQGFGAIQSSGTAWTVNGTSYLSSNDFANPDTVGITEAAINNVTTSFTYTLPAHSVSILDLSAATNSIQTPLLTGKVTDQATGVGVGNASVWTSDTSRTSTDTTGYYDLNLSDGSYTVSATADGYNLEELQNVDVTNPGHTAIPIGLRKMWTLTDDFSGTSLSSQWTPTLLAGSTNGSLSLSNGILTINGGNNSRYGILSNLVVGSKTMMTRVKARIFGYTGTNALINIYGGSGAGDFNNYVEFGIENGVLKVFAPGADWTGGAASTPANLAVVVSGYGASGRTFQFYYNDTLVHTTSNYTGVPNADFRLFLYGWSTSVSNWDWVSVRSEPSEAIYDDFPGTNLSSQWTPTLLSGSTNGSVSLSSGILAINGGNNSRYGVLSAPISNSASRTSVIEAKVKGYSGSNAWLNIYGGTGAGDYTRFVEYGIDNGVLKVVTENPGSNWTGDSALTPASLKVVVSGYGTSGRRFDFYYNGSLVHTLDNYTGVPNADFRLFLYGWSTGETDWDWVSARVEPSETVYDDFPGSSLSNLWTPTLLTGSTSGSTNLSNGILTINGGNNSRYGILSNAITNSNTSIMSIEALVTGYSGNNALLDIYGGTGSGDFSKFIEFGIENGHLQVYGDGVANWTGRKAGYPAALRIVVGRYGANGRDFEFFYNGDLVYTLNSTTAVPSGTYRLFLYGWSSSTTHWDWVTVQQK